MNKTYSLGSSKSDVCTNSRIQESQQSHYHQSHEKWIFRQEKVGTRPSLTKLCARLHRLLDMGISASWVLCDCILPDKGLQCVLYFWGGFQLYKNLLPIKILHWFRYEEFVFHQFIALLKNSGTQGQVYLIHIVFNMLTCSHLGLGKL